MKCTATRGKTDYLPLDKDGAFWDGLIETRRAGVYVVFVSSWHRKLVHWCRTAMSGVQAKSERVFYEADKYPEGEAECTRRQIVGELEGAMASGRR